MVEELSIPVINISNYLQGDNAKRDKIRAELLNVLSTHGFMYVESAHFPQDEIEKCLQENTRFFERFPSEFLAKHAVNSIDTARRGYSASKSENFGILVGKKGVPNDAVEKFRFGPFVQDQSALLSSPSNSDQEEQEHQDQKKYYTSNEAKFMHFIPNQLSCSVPLTATATATTTAIVGDVVNGCETAAAFTTTQEVTLFEETRVKHFYQCFNAVACEVLTVLQDCLALPTGYFDAKMDKHTSIMTFNCYKGLQPGTANKEQGEEEGVPLLSAPAVTAGSDASAEQVRVSEHTDISMLTLLLQSPPPTATAVDAVKRTVRSSRLQVKVADVPDVSNSDCFCCSAPQQESVQGSNVPYLTEKTATTSEQCQCQCQWQWRNIPYHRGAIIVNIGDCLSYWTRGRFASTLHRVADYLDVDVGDTAGGTTAAVSVCSNEEGVLQSTVPEVEVRDRYSVAYFVSPNYNSPLERHWPAFQPQSNTRAVDSAGLDDVGINTGVSTDNGTINNLVADSIDIAPLTYSEWRKQRIKFAMKHLKNSKSDSHVGSGNSDEINGKVNAKNKGKK